jgi:hypothetical protein
MHRFTKDTKWGKLPRRIREGKGTMEDIRNINNNCLIKKKDDTKPNVQVATAHNKDRDAINTAAFEEWCINQKDMRNANSVIPGAVMIFMDNLQVQNDKQCFVPLVNQKLMKTFCQECGENDAFTGKRNPRADPVLKLWHGCPVMMTSNLNVASGQASGSRLTVEQVLLKPGETTFEVNLGAVKVRGVRESQVDHLVLKHQNEDIKPKIIRVKSTAHSFKAKINGSVFHDSPVEARMKGRQFPVVSNVATTGHKLQGSSLDDLAVNDWMGQAHWACVVLSRTRTMAGLKIRKRLPENLSQFIPDPKIKNMLDGFKSVQPTNLSDFERAEMCLEDAETQ